MLVNANVVVVVLTANAVTIATMVESLWCDIRLFSTIMVVLVLDVDGYMVTAVGT